MVANARPPDKFIHGVQKLIRLTATAILNSARDELGNDQNRTPAERAAVYAWCERMEAEVEARMDELGLR